MSETTTSEVRSLRRIEQNTYTSLDEAILDAQSLAGEYRAVRSQLHAHQQLHKTLQALNTQQSWDMRSLELTVEKLREENGRLREVVNTLEHDLNQSELQEMRASQ